MDSGWDIKRQLTKINYQIHTEAIKQYLIPKEISVHQKEIIYANEADVLNIALYGKTAKQWRDENPKLEGNIRDYSTVEQLVVLANMESLNALMIDKKIDQSTRLTELNHLAINQMKSLINNSSLKKLE